MPDGENWGCPPSCRAKHKKQIEALPCADLAAGTAELSAYGGAFLNNVMFSRGSNTSTLRKFSSGCAQLAKEVPCAPQHGFKLLKAFCPVTCGCTHGEGDRCPSSCSAIEKPSEPAASESAG